MSECTVREGPAIETGSGPAECAPGLAALTANPFLATESKALGIAGGFQQGYATKGPPSCFDDLSLMGRSCADYPWRSPRTMWNGSGPDPIG